MDYQMDSICIHMTNEQGKKYNLKLEEIPTYDNQIEEYWHEIWNQYNFGPVKVPEHKYFVMGNNREYSIDSRHIGFIGSETVIGVKIF